MEGRQARSLIEGARRLVKQTVDAPTADLYFTSGATEANNWIVQTARSGGEGCVLVSAIEHPSVLEAASNRVPIPVEPSGRANPDVVEALILRHRPSLVSVMLANNETGVIQDITEIARICEENAVHLHVDAVQALGKIPVSFDRLGCTTMSLSAHKFGGPPGIGALIACEGHEVTPMLRGGRQEKRMRAGTEAIAAIAGFMAALRDIDFDEMDRLSAFHRAFEDDLRRRIPDAAVIGGGSPRLPNTSCITLPGIAAETSLIHLDLAGIAVSSGAACSSGKVAPSHVLEAMGLAPDQTRTALRISSGWHNCERDFERLLEGLGQLYERTRSEITALEDLAH
jgi:cysteine desulfurase